MEKSQSTLERAPSSEDEFVRWIGESNNEQIATRIRAMGVHETLAKIFEGFRERFRPDRANGACADVQFVIKDGTTEYLYVVSISEEICRPTEGRALGAKVTLTTDVASFVRLVTGHVSGAWLFLRRELQVGGDLLFAQRMLSFFETPRT